MFFSLFGRFGRFGRGKIVVLVLKGGSSGEKDKTLSCFKIVIEN
jgi:hypothetical protein